MSHLVGWTGPQLVALAVLASLGTAHGLWTHRWTASTGLARAVERTATVPAVVGTWDGQDLPVDAAMMRRAEVQGALSRAYVDRATGARVTVLIVTGPPGPIALHTPDVCYEGAGFHATAPPATERVRLAGASTATLFGADFVKDEGGVLTTLRILWTWSDGGPWLAPENPRLRFAAAPALHKVYLIREASSADPTAEAAAVRAFAGRFLPACHQALFPPPVASASLHSPSSTVHPPT